MSHILSRPILSRCSVFAITALAVLLTSCAEEQIRVESVPKGSEVIGGVTLLTQASSDGAPSDGAPPSAAFSPVWIVPEGWREMPDNPPMRLATYLMPGPDGEVEVAITRFPGDVGGMLANVNRWRGQIGLGPVAQQDLDAMLEPFENPGFTGHLLHLQGATVDMLAASIHESAHDRTWFVRVIADAETVESVKPGVFAFARTFGLNETH